MSNAGSDASSQWSAGHTPTSSIANSEFASSSSGSRSGSGSINEQSHTSPANRPITHHRTSSHTLEKNYTTGRHSVSVSVQTTVNVDIKVTTPAPAVVAGGIIPPGISKQEPSVDCVHAIYRQRDPNEKTMEMSGGRG